MTYLLALMFVVTAAAFAIIFQCYNEQKKNIRLLEEKVKNTDKKLHSLAQHHDAACTALNCYRVYNNEVVYKVNNGTMQKL